MIVKTDMGLLHFMLMSELTSTTKVKVEKTPLKVFVFDYRLKAFLFYTFWGTEGEK